MSDTALVAACAVSDHAALGTLFDRYHRDVHRFIARLGVSGLDGEDSLQETFVQVWHSAAKFRGGSTVRTWIFGIAANVTRQFIRGESRRNRAVTSFGQSSRDSITPPPGPEQIAVDRELLGRLEKAFDQLNHDLRVTLVMCDVEGISGMEAAKALGVRPGTLWRRRHEARSKLRRAMKLEEER